MTHPKNAEYQHNWYLRNKELQKHRVKTREKDLVQWWKEHKASLKCSRCPENWWACLDFHHLDPKQKDVSLAEALSRGWGRERMLKEAAKCIVLCANCHRKEHNRFLMGRGEVTVTG